MLDYPMVQKRLTAWGFLPHLERAHTTRLQAADARIYVHAICGPETRVAVKRIRGSWAGRLKNRISLSCDAARTVRLSDVLHEAAHILDGRKGKMRDKSHGESFCRTYARLLREVVGG